MFDIEEELKKLPGKPGVYLMHDAKDAIIYVGKAISLKNRVRQYFQPSRNVSPKIEKMISQIDHFEYIITDSEVEALVLESNLIKEHRPKYNTMLKDDKSYPFIKATVGEDFPRLVFSRQEKRDKSKYFGPYTSAGSAKDTLELLRKIYHIRSCRRVLPRDTGKERPCLNYHIGQCDAPCQGYISSGDYKEHFREALKILEGDYTGVLQYLQEKMAVASAAMQFEEAAQYRDLMESVRKASVHQKITSFDGLDRDIIALAKDQSEAVVQVFFIREGRMIGRDHFHLGGVDGSTRQEILQAFLKQFYAGTPFIPKELMLEYEIEDAEVIARWLSERRGDKVRILVPKKGQKERLVELAHKNALMVLEQDAPEDPPGRGEDHRCHAGNSVPGSVSREYTEWSPTIFRYISGFQSVGSMVVFEDGSPRKSDYRKFRIKTVQGPDDYASMREVLTRRFEHGLEEEKKLAEQGFDEENGSFTPLSGSDHDGRWKGAGAYCRGGAS